MEINEKGLKLMEMEFNRIPLKFLLEIPMEINGKGLKLKAMEFPGKKNWKMIEFHTKYN